MTTPHWDYNHFGGYEKAIRLLEGSRLASGKATGLPQWTLNKNGACSDLMGIQKGLLHFTFIETT